MSYPYEFVLNGRKIKTTALEFPLDYDGILINWMQTSKKYLPQKFIYGDGTTLRRFVVVDRSPGSPVDLLTHQIKNDILDYFNRSQTENLTQAQVSQYLALNLKKYINFPENSEKLNWEKDVQPLATLPELKSIYTQTIYNHHHSEFTYTRYKHPVTSFDQIINEKKGYCIEMVMLASFVLESFSLKHDIIFGATIDYEYFGHGHSWIKFDSNSILDVAWQTYYENVVLPPYYPIQDWFWFGNYYGGSYRHEYHNFPLISFDAKDFND